MTEGTSHRWAVYEKMVVKESFDEIFDLVVGIEYGFHDSRCLRSAGLDS